MEVRPLSRPEFDTLVDWAAAEGWNPGLHDAEIFWATDPEGFVAADVDGEMVGGGSIVSYGRRFGFMGFFIVRPDHRGRGIGRELWNTRKALLLDRLDDDAVIGMDGVYAMQDFYTAGGFAFSHRDIRFEADVEVLAPLDRRVGDANDIDLDDVVEYDARHFPTPRPEFVRRWINQREGLALVALDDDTITGYAVARPCRVGHKVGPLFADDPTTADRLFRSVCGRLGAGRFQIDVPDTNAYGLALAERYGMREVFGCARMYLGPEPELPWDSIFGVTTFELG